MKHEISNKISLSSIVKEEIPLLWIVFLCSTWNAIALAQTKPNVYKNRQTSSKQYKGHVVHIPPRQVSPILKTDRTNPLLDFKSFLKEKISNPVLPAIQKEITKIIQSEKQALLKSAKELFNKIPHSALLPYRLYVEEIKLFKPLNPDIVSVRIRLYTYTGGAHGGTQYYSWNYSQKQRKFLSLNDIFPVSDYCAQLVMVGRKPLFQKKPLSECLNPSPSQNITGSEELLNLVIRVQNILFRHKKQGNKYDKYIKGDILRGTQKHFKIWNIHQNEIIIVFPEYQVGPYAAGSFEVFVPLP